MFDTLIDLARRQDPDPAVGKARSCSGRAEEHQGRGGRASSPGRTRPAKWARKKVRLPTCAFQVVDNNWG